MKLKNNFLLTFSLLIGVLAFAQRNRTTTEFYTATKNWFDAWQLVSKKIYRIHTTKAVDFVFFDEKNVYATSSLSIPKGKAIVGPSLAGKAMNWKVAEHGDTLTLPDGRRVEVGIMSFTAPSSHGNPFFVMPLPSFWKTAGVTSKELGFENLLTGIFLHEFSHSQQVLNFGKRIAQFEKMNAFDVEMNDDIVQALFKNDSSYKAVFDAERRLLYQLATATTSSSIDIQDVFANVRKRQHDYFTGKYTSLKEIEEVFLTMEGLGQHAMYAWLVHPQGGKLPKELAIAGVRRGGKWWSQDEGLALFLLLEQKIPSSKWGRLFFEDKVISVVELLEQKQRNFFFAESANYYQP